jgi:hypothetical protein
VPRPERVVRALGTLQESGETVLLAESLEAGVPLGEDLVGIRLMTDIPDYLVRGR